MEEITKKNEKTDIANNVENTDNTYKAEKTDNTEKTGKLSSKHWAIIGIVAALVVLAGALIFFLGDSSAEKLQEQLDLGQKYLEEMNYEEAVVAFEAAIEIDPMSVDAYLGLVEVYIRTGDFDTALEYARKGYEMTGDERLKEKIDMIESGNITASNGWIMRESRYDENGNVIVIWSLSMYQQDDSPMQIGLCKDEYEYDASGNVIVSKYYDVNGILEGYSEPEYDSNGNIITNRWYGTDGTFEAYTENEYDADGALIAEKQYDAEGILTSYSEWEYDSNGNETAKRHYDAEGTLRYCIESEYDSEGNLVLDREYDGDGNLTLETRYD